MDLEHYVVLLDSLQVLTKKLSHVSDQRDVNLIIHLGDNKIATVKSPYPCVNLRQWYYDSERMLKPGHGVVLHACMWDKFLRINAEIDKEHSKQRKLWFLKCPECNPDMYMHKRKALYLPSSVGRPDN